MNMSNIWIINIISVFILCVLLAGVVIPEILLIAFRKRLFDEPDGRKIHQGIVPRLGGIAFKPVAFFSTALILAFNISAGHHELLQQIGAEALPLSYAFCAIIILYLVGIADDLIGIRYRAKFIFQALSGAMLAAGGVLLSDFHGLASIHALPILVSVPITVFTVVLIINAINLIDGLDGLASGLSGITFLSYGLTFVCYHQYLYAMFSFAALGVLIPFFYYNVFGKAERRRKIFMGDAGSLTIGIMICYLSIQIARFPHPTTPQSLNPIVLAQAPLLLPCLDVARVFLHRIRNGHSPFLPDKNHIHHKLMAIGMSQHQAMLTIVVTSTAMVLSNILLSAYIDATLLLSLNVMLWIIVNILITHRIHTIHKQHNNPSYQQ